MYCSDALLFTQWNEVLWPPLAKTSLITPYSFVLCLLFITFWLCLFVSHKAIIIKAQFSVFEFALNFVNSTFLTLNMIKVQFLVQIYSTTAVMNSYYTTTVFCMNWIMHYQMEHWILNIFIHHFYVVLCWSLVLINNCILASSI